MALPALALTEPVSVEECLKQEEKALEKHECFDGHCIAMAGASRMHSQIQTNLLRILASHFSFWLTRSGQQVFRSQL